MNEQGKVAMIVSRRASGRVTTMRQSEENRVKIDADSPAMPGSKCKKPESINKPDFNKLYPNRLKPFASTYAFHKLKRLAYFSSSML
jgi:hypothetical protein